MAPVVLIYCFTYFARDDKDGMNLLKGKMLFSHSHHLITVSEKKSPFEQDTPNIYLFIYLIAFYTHKGQAIQ